MTHCLPKILHTANYNVQEELTDTDTATLQEVADETTRLKDTTVSLKAEEKDIRLALREGASKIPLPELKASVAGLEEQKGELTARLEKLKGGSVKPVSAEDREKVSTEHRKWMKSASARKKIRTELWKEIEGHVEREKVSETKEELGLEF